MKQLLGLQKTGKWNSSGMSPKTQRLTDRRCLEGKSQDNDLHLDNPISRDIQRTIDFSPTPKGDSAWQWYSALNDKI